MTDSVVTQTSSGRWHEPGERRRTYLSASYPTRRIAGRRPPATAKGKPQKRSTPSSPSSWAMTTRRPRPNPRALCWQICQLPANSSPTPATGTPTTSKPPAKSPGEKPRPTRYSTAAETPSGTTPPSEATVRTGGSTRQSLATTASSPSPAWATVWTPRNRAYAFRSPTRPPGNPARSFRQGSPSRCLLASPS